MAVPILMYHVITKAPGAGRERRAVGGQGRVRRRDAGAARGRLHGGHAASRLGTAGSTAGRCPASRSCVTFDDGYLSHYTHAKPVLRALGWPGVLFLDQGDRPGRADRAPAPLADQGGLGDRLAHAHPPGPHHPRRRRAAARARRVAARAARRFGVPADFFAYPAGTLRRAGRRGHRGRRLHGGDHGRARASPPGATTPSPSTACA